MQYRFDWKAFLLATGVVIASGVTLYAVHRVQQPRNAQNLLAQSETAEREGNLDHAIRSLDRYLTLNPADTNSRYRYGELLERIADGGLTRFFAINVYQKVLEQDSKRMDARQRLAILLCESGQWDQAMKHLQVLWKDYRNEADPAAFVRMADCSYRIKEPQPTLAQQVIDVLVNGNQFPDIVRAEAYVVRSKHRSTKKNIGFKLSESEFPELKKELSAKNKETAEAVYQKLTNFKRDEVSKNEFVSRLDESLTENELREFKDIILKHADLEGLISDDLNKAKALAPSDPEVIIAVAEQDLRKNLRDNARKELTVGRDKHPKDQRFYLALAQLDLEAGHPDSAIAELRSGLNVLPDHTDLLVELINQLCEAGGKEKIEEAKSLFDTARKNKKQRMTSYDDQFLTARLEAAENDWVKATKHFEALLGITSPQSGRAFLIYRLLCQHATQVGDTYKRTEWLDKQIKNVDGSPVLTLNPRMRFEYAVALVEAGKAAQAIVQLNELVKGDSPYLPACLALARWEAIQVLERKNAGEKANWMEVDRLLAHAPRMFKLTDKSFNALKDKIPDPVLAKLQSSLNLNNREFTSRDRFETAISTVLSQSTVLSPKEDDDLKKVMKVIVEQAAGPQDLTMAIAEAEIYAVRDESEREKARLILESLCKDEKARKIPEVWMARIRFELENPQDRHSNKADAAASGLLDEAKKCLPKDASTHMMEIYLAVRLPRDQAIEKVKLATKSIGHLPREKAAKIWELAATYYLFLKGSDEQALAAQELAFNAAKKVVDFAPNKLQSQLLLFEAAVRVGPKGNATANEAIEIIQRLEGPNGGIASYCKALRSILFVTDAKSESKKSELKKLEKQIDDAVKTASEELSVAQAHRPNWSKISILWAKLYTLKGEPKSATEKYWAAFNQGDRSFEVIAPLISACLAEERFQDAVDLIPQDKPALSLTELRMFSEVYLQAVKYELALKAAKKAAQLNTATVDEHLLLALVYAKQDDKVHAKEWLAKACMVADSPEPWVARIQYLLASKPDERSQARDDAKVVLDALNEKLKDVDRKPADPNANNNNEAGDKPRKISQTLVKVALARCIEVFSPDNEKEVEKAYEVVRQVNQDDPDFSKCVRTLAGYYLRKADFQNAQKLIKPLIDGPQIRTLGPADVKELRRQFAIIMANSGNFRLCNEALAELDKNKEDGKEDRLDALARAAVLAKKPGEKRTAIQLYEKLQKESPLSIEAKFIYAQLCIITGDTGKGYSLMDEVVKQSYLNPVYTIYWVNILLEDDELAHAKYLVGKLRESGNADSWQLIELQAQLKHARGETGEAAKLIADYKPKNDAELLAAARRLEEYKDTDNAKGMLLSKSKESPMVGLAYAAFLARQNRMKESLEECGKLIGKLPGPVVAGMAIEFLGYKQEKDVYQQLDPWLAKVSNESDARVAAFMKADLLDHEGDYKGAIIAYRQLLNSRADNSLVLYRLARLILLQSTATNEDAKEAEELLTTAISQSGPQTHLKELRAIAFLRQNRVEEAIGDLRKTLAEQPTASGHFLLAVALRMDEINKKGKPGPQSLKELQESTPRSSRASFKLTSDSIKALQNSSEFKALQKSLPNSNVLNILKQLVEGKQFSRAALEQEITDICDKEEERLNSKTTSQNPLRERCQPLQILIMNYAGFNTNALHPLEEKAFQNLRSKAFEVESKSVSISP